MSAWLISTVFARSVSIAASGSGLLRELSQGDNRDPRSAGVHVVRSWEEFERYELDLYPATARIVEAGCGTFVARVGDEGSDAAEREMLRHEGFEGVVAAAAGDESGVYLIELFTDNPASDLQALEAPLSLVASAAIPRHPHRRSARTTSASERPLELTVAIAGRLASATSAHEVCNTAVQEVQRAFECSLVQILSVDDDQLTLRSELGALPTAPGWSQSAEAGLIGRCIRERAPVIAADVNREPQYRSTSATRDVRSELVVPIYDGYDVWGVINLEDVAVATFRPADARLVESVAAQIGGKLTSVRLYKELDRAYIGTAEALSAALEAKDSYTAEHSQSLVDNVVAVGRLLGWRGEELRMLRYAAAFHDIGKLGISPDLLNKPGPLTSEEWEEMARHTLIGERILAPIEFLAPIRPLVRCAHERWDGKGYPDGLAGEEIPLGARILFVCDSYDAMTTDRPYQQALPVEEARRELRKESGRQFDPVVVDALLMVLESADEQKTRRPRSSSVSPA